MAKSKWVSSEDKIKIMQMVRDGIHFKQICEIIGISRYTYYNIVKETKSTSQKEIVKMTEKKDTIKEKLVRPKPIYSNVNWNDVNARIGKINYRSTY